MIDLLVPAAISAVVLGLVATVLALLAVATGEPGLLLASGVYGAGALLAAIVVAVVREGFHR